MSAARDTGTTPANSPASSPANSQGTSSGCYPDFHRAYVDQLRLVYEHPTYYNAPRGNKSRERLAAQFQLSDPCQRVAFVPARRVNIVFNFAEALWYLAGRNDLEYIAYYASNMRLYSMDGEILTGTAYGAKIFGGPPHQYDTIVELIKSDPDTKRAVIQIFNADELLVPDNIDVSCTLGLHFLLREGRLHAIAYMRANDVFRGMVSDLFSFTLIQEFLARDLGAELGTYTHVAGSIHAYEPDYPRARAVLADPASTQPPPFTLPPMPAGDNRPALNALLEIEEQLRLNKLRLPTNLEGVDLPPYWAQVALLFETYRRVKQREPLTSDLIEALAPPYRLLVKARWSAKMETR